MGQRDWAVVVGIRHYPELGDLNGPENDALAFRDWLVAPNGGAVPQKQIQLILSSDFNVPFSSAVNAEPNTQRIQMAFENLQELATANSNKGNGLLVGDRLYIYMSGHGCAPRFKDAALLTANATRLRVGYHILGRLFAEWFMRSGYFNQVLLFMDCCRESFPQATPNIPPYIDVIAPEAIDTAKVFYGFGTKWSHLARERTINGKSRGVFTVALLAGLNGEACEPDGTITAASLGDYLYNNMKQFLKAEDLNDPEIAKEPDLEYDANAGKSFVIATVAPPMYPIVIHLPPSAAGKKVEILGDKFQAVASTNGVPPAWNVNLPRGMYMAQVLQSDLQTSFDVPGGGNDVNF